MVAFIIYWAAIFVCIAWGLLSFGLSAFYYFRKENGNLWAFAFFNVIFAIILTIVLVIYRTWDFEITTYSSLIYTILGCYGVLTIAQAVLGIEPKEPAAA